MELIPVDPKSQVYKDLMAVSAANTQPEQSGTQQLVPVDPKSPTYKAIMSGADIGKDVKPPMSSEQIESERKASADRVAAVGEAQPKEPLFMEKYGLPRPPGAELMSEWGPTIANTALQFTPGGRMVKGAVGAGGSVMQDVMEGETPSVGRAIIGGLGGVFSPEIVKAGKAVVRGASRMFGSKPLKQAGGAVYEETKALAKPTQTLRAEQEMLDQTATFGRTAPESQVKVVTEMFDRVANAKAAGQPLTYGEVFNNVTQLNQHAKKLYRGTDKEAAGKLQKLSEAFMQDLADSGPEAAEAVKQYKRAIGLFGGYDGVLNAVRKITGVGVGASTALAAVLKPGTIYVSAPAALLGGIANLSMRLPGGVGEGIAKALISDPSKLSQGAVSALVQAINQGVEY